MIYFLPSSQYIIIAERILLEAKYKEKRSILYEARKNLVTGAVEAEDNTATGKLKI